MTRTTLLSILVAAACVWPSVLAAQSPLFAPYESRVVHLPPVYQFDPGEQAEGLQTAGVDLFDGGNPGIETQGMANPGIGHGLPGPLGDGPLPFLPLPPQTEDRSEIRLPPIGLGEKPRTPGHWLSDWGGDLLTDYRNFYSLGNLVALGAGLGVGAAMANTPTDEKLRDFWQENVRCAGTDEYWEAFHSPKVLGEGLYTLPAYGGAILIGLACEEGTFGRGLGEWGWRSLRTVAVGAPVMLSLQYVIGASRPDAEIGSGWHPFQDVHGVSGHAFMGAVPLLTAAKMVESPFWKGVFYAGSVLPGLSRINDDDHYSSQVVLGWWIAFLAANAVDRTVTDRLNLSIGPVPMGNGLGMGLVWRR